MIDLMLLALIPLATSMAITALAFALIKRFVVSRAPLTIASASVFLALAFALAAHVGQSGRDLHGIATFVFAAIGGVSVPITIITAWLLARRYA